MSEARIKNLANLMRMKKERGEKFVLMLGAGASMSSNVPSTVRIMEELVSAHDHENPLETTEIRFEKLWARSSPGARTMMMQPYLERTPSVGFDKLVDLIVAGYFDVALTFNFDTLFEKALDKAKRANASFDYGQIIRGVVKEDAIRALVDRKDPPFKLVKLHGSLDSADNLLFDAREMREYPAPVAALVREVTRRDIIICGYAFNDTCVEVAFAERGESIHCVDPGGAPKRLHGFLKDRVSESNEIRMRFDDFFTELHHELLSVAEPAQKPPPNPFKFLESYDRTDRERFTGRSKEIETFLKYLGKANVPRLLVLPGPGKAGKSSLVRAGLIPALDRTRYRPVYLRCRADIETQLPSELAERGLIPEGLGLSEALKQLGTSPDTRRVVLFLDQFERVTNRFDAQGKADTNELGDFLQEQVLPATSDDMTIVLVVADEANNLGVRISQVCELNDIPKGTILCRHFGREEVVKIMKDLAAGFAFDDAIFEDLATNFENTKNTATPENRFTLAHVHAVLHILASSQEVKATEYKLMFDQQNLHALHAVINVSEFMSFAEDCVWPNAAWLRNMIKVPLREPKERMAEFIKRNYENLLPPALQAHDRDSHVDLPVVTAG